MFIRKLSRSIQQNWSAKRCQTKSMNMPYTRNPQKMDRVQLFFLPLSDEIRASEYQGRYCSPPMCPSWKDSESVLKAPFLVTLAVRASLVLDNFKIFCQF